MFLFFVGSHHWLRILEREKNIYFGLTPGNLIFWLCTYLPQFNSIQLEFISINKGIQYLTKYTFT